MSAPRLALAVSLCVAGVLADELEARRRAWDEVFRYHDELLHRYPPGTSRRRENGP
jgi:hypothetical protein